VEVKFRQSGDIHSRVVAAMRKTLRDAKLTPQVNLSEPEPQDADERSESIRNAISDFFAGKDHGGKSGGASGHARHDTAEGTIEQDETNTPQPDVHYGNTMQMLDSFIVEEAQNGIRLIDQHALHERILYNHMKKSLQSGRLDSQQLLVPDMVELSSSEFYTVMDLQDELKRFGMEIESFGDDTVVVRSFPQILGSFDGKSFFRDLLDDLPGNGEHREVGGRVNELLKIMACRGAVKAGDRLSPKQIQNILQQRDESGQTDTCPHGRPTSIILSHQELNRQFGRD
jgi:DNA mismatch repair ATPase MutL